MPGSPNTAEWRTMEQGLTILIGGVVFLLIAWKMIDN